ncbi:hypothetical protein F3Y22_tig00111022pilonHSYRG00443 [Hibiscus syriacus]|uniref:Uncharacterized protein n=1 Tax=Hibiscus syriacus TaxID=106335 RepID=A0A6A2Z6U6_HIBSY|nr:hypothetical protein F3Y22_tig00111022pilonHSYRG00443 [Hibiscus syriacus]
MPRHQEIYEQNENAKFGWHFESEQSARRYFRASCLLLSKSSTREICLEDPRGGIDAATAGSADDVACPYRSWDKATLKTLVPPRFELKKLEREGLTFLSQSYLSWHFSLTSLREWHSKRLRGARSLGAVLGGRGKHLVVHVEGFLSFP